MSATLSKRRQSANPSEARRVARGRRHYRVRKALYGTAQRPRLVVTRSLKHVVAQVIDDDKGHTLASASSMDASIRNNDGDKKAAATAVGKLVAERAKAAGVETVVFDRGGNAYHGRVACLADAAREGGLSF